MLTRGILKKVGTPCVVLMPNQTKAGYRLPNDLPVVVDATAHNYPREDLLRWLHMFVTLATLERKAFARVYVAWPDCLEEIDLDTCPRHEPVGYNGTEDGNAD